MPCGCCGELYLLYMYVFLGCKWIYMYVHVSPGVLVHVYTCLLVITCT